MVDKQRDLQLANAQGDERVCSSLRDVAERQRRRDPRIIIVAEGALANSRNAAQVADAKASEVKDRIARLQRGEDVPGGLESPLDEYCAAVT